jgi:hypothetical protein
MLRSAGRGAVSPAGRIHTIPLARLTDPRWKVKKRLRHAPIGGQPDRTRYECSLPPRQDATRPDRIPRAVRTASSCGTGRASNPPSTEMHNWCKPAKCPLHVRSTPAALATRRSEVRPAKYSSRAVLPAPSTMHHQRPALTRPDRLDQPIKHATLGTAIQNSPSIASHRGISRLHTVTLQPTCGGHSGQRRAAIANATWSRS